MSQTNYLDDRPVHDSLWEGLAQLSTQLASRLPRFPSSSAVLLSGPWGSGKTSLLNHLKSRLEARGSLVCLFEAWRHEREISLLGALARTVSQELNEALKEDPRKKLANSAAQRLRRAAVSFSLGVAPGLVGLLGGPLGTLLSSAIQAVNTASESDSKPLSREEFLDELVRDRAEELWQAFKYVVECFASKENPLVVLVDDLDRCSPDATVRLLDEIRHLAARADDQPVRFVFALDRGVAAKAISRKFDGIDNYEGNRYLEKVFPLVFTLPRPATREIETLVRSQVSLLGPWRKEDIEVVRAVFANPIFANARLVKRVLNRYALWLDFEGALQKAPESQPVDLPLDEKETGRRLTLVRWLAASERWPGLRGLLSRRGPEYWKRLWDFARGVDGRDQPPDPDAARILREQDLRIWFAERDDDPRNLEEAEQSLRRWGL